jgi:6-phosphogluconolactonase
MKPTIELVKVADPEAAAEAALAIVLAQAAAAIDARGRFVLALCGGRTPGRLYELLADAGQDWRRWHLVYGDERCLPPGDEERNSSLVSRCWLDRTDFPAQNHHVPEAELGADIAAPRYARAIAPLLPIDLALLGMGEDGHTASLFPGHSHPDATVVAVHGAPKPPAERVSLGYAALNSADTVCFLVTGDAKRDALRRWQQGDDIPIARISGRARTCLVTDTTPD